MTTDWLDIAPQADLGAERCVLGAMMQSAAAAEEVIHVVGLRAIDFADHMHADLYRYLCDRYEHNQHDDLSTLVSDLAVQPSPVGRCANFLDYLGGSVGLYDIYASVPTVGNAGHYAETVVDRALRRRVNAAGTRIIQMAVTATGLDGAELVTRAKAEIDDIVPASRTQSISMATAIEMVMGTITGEKPDPGLSTGFHELDRYFTLKPGQMIIVAGRPGSGKSILGLDIARHAAIRLGVNTLVASWEMSLEEITLRNVAAEAGIRHDRLVTGQLDDLDASKLGRALGVMDRAPLRTWDAASAGLLDVRAEIRKTSVTEPVGVVVLDYLQLIRPNTRLSSRQEQVAEMSRNAKLMAKEERLTAIIPAQLNRGPEGRTDKRPQLSDMRESGSIEQDADIVLMLHRPDYYDPSDRPGEVDFIIAKNRHGPTGTVTVAAQLHLMRFKSFAREEVRPVEETWAMEEHWQDAA